MSSSLPIGVFDSGVGGLSILDKIHQLLPRESLLYVADSAFAPYGPKGDEFIIQRSRHMMAFFQSQQVKAVVVACNTATAAAVALLRQEYTLPIIGMEPALKPAATASTTGVIGVLATEGTLASDKFVDLKNRFEGDIEIITMPCPGLVEHIERIVPDVDAINQLLQKYMSPLLEKNVDTIVLGCTHYSFLTQQIKKIAGGDIAVIDTDDAVARRLYNVLEKANLLKEADNSEEIIFYSSGEPGEQKKVISRCWGKQVDVLVFS